jgi:alanine dehydrogenase
MKMIQFGIVREGKTPQDNRTPFSPKQCKAIQAEYPNVHFTVQPSPIRCFTDDEYRAQGITVAENLEHCSVLFGVKEAVIDTLIPNKTYFFFSHTKKAQPYNQGLMKALMAKRIRMIDYECLTHDDGHRIVGFGFWAGVVGAHNGLLTYGQKTGLFHLPAVHTLKNFEALKNAYEGLKLPNMRIVLTGSGRVASGALDILQYLDIKEVSPEDYLHKTFEYPVFVHLKGKELYTRKGESAYDRDEFHAHAERYECLFAPYMAVSDLLINGIYWDKKIPRLFELSDMQSPSFRISVIADITCDEHGSVPCNVGASTIADPVYGFDKTTLQKTEAFLPDTVDVMAVDNLPNELPRDASVYFGSHLMSFILPALVEENMNAPVLERGTICQDGALGKHYDYLHEYAFA